MLIVWHVLVYDMCSVYFKIREVGFYGMCNRYYIYLRYVFTKYEVGVLVMYVK